MDKRNKRILWLINHKTLMQSEVPLLTKLGFEVYTPKKYPMDEANLSTNIDYQYDETLTIPKSLLKKMNQFDFYSSQWDYGFQKQLNKYFGVAFCAFFPSMVDNVLAKFDGDVFLRAFGLGGNLNYATLLTTYYNENSIKRIQNQNKVWFAQAYGNLTSIEPKWIKDISVTLPVSMSTSFFERDNTWIGGINKLLFVCPRIKSSPYYEQVYLNFKKDFSSFPHIITGRQTEPVSDENVTGFIQDETYYDMMKTHQVMFYHSTEERHLHYHPLEAIVIGMPVIYMAGGMLDYMAGERLPGCSSNIEEAKEKVAQILNGNEEFIRSVTISQKKILSTLEPENLYNVWVNNFLPIADGRRKLVQLQDPQLTLGIWIPLTQLGPFPAEGIMRLLGFVIKGWQEDQNLNLIISCVSWEKKPIISFLDQLGIASSKIKFITTSNRVHPTILLYAWLKKTLKKRPKTKRKSLIAFLKDIGIGRIGKRILAEIVYQWWLAILLSPILLVLGAFGAIIIAIRTIFKFFDKNSKKIFQKFYNSTIAKFNLASTFTLIVTNISSGIFSLIIDAENRKLINCMNSNAKIDCWYFPFPRGKYIDNLNKPVVVSLPDIVHLDFPVRYNNMDPNYMPLIDDIIDSLRKADASISFSDFVKDNHIVKPGYHSSETAFVINHAPIDLKELLGVSKNSSIENNKEVSIQIINDYIGQSANKFSPRDYDYLKNIQFKDIDYIFISSQNRPHKNLLFMLQAYEILLREHYINTKLIFTGKPDDQICSFIQSRRLNLDVISLHNLSPKVHAAFYCCANLSIVPTLFEGGFPFIFSESLSLGTPVLLSDIPVVREVLNGNKYDKIIFDPYDISDIVKKTSWAFSHKKELLKFEQAIYHDMKSRNWNDVSKEYYDVFTSVINTSKTNKISKSL